MFAVQFWVVADYTFCQALFTVAIFALVAIKNTLSICMMSAFILGYHGGCRVLKKSFCVKACLWRQLSVVRRPLLLAGCVGKCYCPDYSIRL
jgi:hypothetical protein